MGVIKLLDKHTAELIAAGEVIERPSSVIKELVENSIDSGAKHITVEIQHGGITFMRVTDDGCGIAREDIPTAFLRHATSKIREKQDLDAIGTLGFRGEALASIAAVSKVTLLSCKEDEDIGTKYEINGGDEIDVDDAGCPGGTTFIIRDLFYNVPARMKFLKKDVSEANSVSGVMDRIALSHPEISFTFIRDGKQTLKTAGDGKLKNAVLSVFGKDFASSLIPIDYEYSGIHISGYISKPVSSRPNRSMQLFFINGRYIKTRTAMAALEEAYKGSIMSGKFPACVLHMNMDCSTLDVNVHPSKLEVRFTNERPIFDTVYHGVKSALMSGDNRSPIRVESPIKPEILSKPMEEAPQLKFVSQAFTQKSDIPAASISPKKAEQAPINEESDEDEPEVFIPPPSSFTPIMVSDVTAVNTYTESVKCSRLAEEKAVSSESNNMTIDTPKYKSCETPRNKDEQIEADVDEQSEDNVQVVADVAVKIDNGDDVSIKFVGEAFATYAVFEYGKDTLIFIDKHAAHERLIYERLKRECGKACGQLLLEPVTVTLDKAEYDAILQNLSVMEESGFDIDDFGMGAVIVRSVPQTVEREDIADTIIEMAGYLVKNKRDIITEKMDWLFKNVACRSAIKAGNKSSELELTELVRELMKNPDVKYCPHGRPIFFTMTRHELEKRFMRV